MSEPVSSLPVVEQVYCRGCGYCLKGTMMRACGECGDGFDLSKPSTFAYERTQTNANNRLYEWASGLYLICIFLWPVLLLLILLELPVWTAGFSLLLVMLVLILLSMQTILAGRVLGYRYALGHVVAELILLPLSTACLFTFHMVVVSVVTIILILVAAHVLDDVKCRWDPNLRMKTRGRHDA